VQRVLPLAFSVLITLAAAPLALMVTQEAGRLKQYGLLAYPALFVIQTIASATLFLPAPGMALVAAASAVLDPLWVGIVAGLGAATGELTGYLLGYYGRRAWGFVALIVLALIPNPVFDAMGILAGGLRYPVLRFWLATAFGKIIRSCLVAYGATLLTLWMRVP
jgi:membrane protein YqaA with SNARE-associated domain